MESSAAVHLRVWKTNRRGQEGKDKKEETDRYKWRRVAAGYREVAINGIEKA